MNNNQNLDNTEIQKTKRKDRFGVDYRNVIVEDGFNGREDYGTEEELLALAEDIAQNGQLVSTIGYRKGEQFILTDGHRRRKAIHLYNEKALNEGAATAPIPIIWCEVGDTNPEERIFLMLRTGADQFKKPLNRVEEAAAIAKLTNLGWNAAEIALKLGRSAAYIYDSLRLDGAPKHLKNMVAAKELPATEAIKIVKSCKDDHAEINKVIEMAKGLAVAEKQDNETTPQEKLDGAESPTITQKKPVKVKTAHVRATTNKVQSDSLTDKLKIAISEAKKVGLNTTTIEAFAELLSLNVKAIDQSVLNDLVGNIAAKFTE